MGLRVGEGKTHTHMHMHTHTHTHPLSHTCTVKGHRLKTPKEELHFGMQKYKLMNQSPVNPVKFLLTDNLKIYTGPNTTKTKCSKYGKFKGMHGRKMIARKRLKH